MSRREVVMPTDDAYGQETHPAYGSIGASRVQVSPPGSTLFDSDVQHGHTIIVRLGRMVRSRELKHDWMHATKEIVEVEMSEAQWASFVSSMNVGNGVPCTIRHLNGERVPGLPYQPRLAASMAETHQAAQEAFDAILTALATYERSLADKAGAKANREALARLRSTIQNATPNVDYAGKKLAEHAENVVQKARADVEAMVAHKAAQLGVTAAEVGVTLAVGSGEVTE